MAQQKSAFLEALEIAFQVGQAIVNAVLKEGGDNDTLHRILTEKDRIKSIAQILAGKAEPVIYESQFGWPVERIGDKIVAFNNTDGQRYELGQLVAAVSDSKVPKGTKGYIVGLTDIQEIDNHFVRVLFVGNDTVHRVSPGEIQPA